MKGTATTTPPAAKSAFHARGNLVAAMVVDSVGTGLFVPFVIIYFLHTTSIPLAVIGVSLSAAALAALPTPVAVGVLVDRFGPQRVVGAGNLVSAAAFVAYLFVDATWQLIAAAFVASVGQAMFWTATRALIGAITQSDERANWFALQQRARNAGYGIGGLLGAVAVSTGSRWGYLMLAAANAASYLVAAGLVLRWSAPKPSTVTIDTSSTQEGAARWPQQVRRGTFDQLLHDRPLVLVCLVNLVFVLCTSVLTVLLAVYLTTVLRSPVWVSGLLFTLATVLVVVAQGATTRYMSRYRIPHVLEASAACFAVSFALLWALAHAAEWLVVPGLIVAIVVFTIAEMLEGPLINALVVDTAPKAASGRYLAAYQLSWSLGGVIAPGLLTWLLTVNIGLPWAGLMALCACAIGAASFLPLTTTHADPGVAPLGRTASGRPPAS